MTNKLLETQYINALIKKADISIEEPCGQNGLNCVFRISLEFPDKIFTCLTFNPCIIPQFLETFGLKKFSEIKGTYIRCKCNNALMLGKDNKETFVGIMPILSDNDCDLLPCEFGIYYGSYFGPIENEEEAINIIKNGKRSKYSMEITDCNIPEVDDILEITEY